MGDAMEISVPNLRQSVPYSESGAEEVRQRQLLLDPSVRTKVLCPRLEMCKLEFLQNRIQHRAGQLRPADEPVSNRRKSKSCRPCQLR